MCLKGITLRGLHLLWERIKVLCAEGQFAEDLIIPGRPPFPDQVIKGTRDYTKLTTTQLVYQ